MAGLAPAQPAYRVIEVAPRPGPGLTSAQAVHRTPFGWAASAWRVDDDGITVEVVVPVGARARVSLPGAAAPVELSHGRHTLTA